jgi:hypothetical protein
MLCWTLIFDLWSLIFELWFLSGEALLEKSSQSYQASAR